MKVVISGNKKPQLDSLIVFKRLSDAYELNF